MIYRKISFQSYPDNLFWLFWDFQYRGCLNKPKKGVVLDRADIIVGDIC